MRNVKGFLAIAAGAMTGTGVYFRWVQPRQRNWGATPEEVARAMPGDELVPDAGYLTNRAITVEAPPECLYPWLVQMGNGRGGLYSWDFLDRLFGFIDAKSATEILPEWQELREGDFIPLGCGADFPVVRLEPNRVFVLGDAEAGWTWQTCLYPLPGNRTRVVTRNRGRRPGSLRGRVGLFVLDLAAFVMVHRWLRVLKGRAEGLWAQRQAGGALHPEDAPGGLGDGRVEGGGDAHREDAAGVEGVDDTIVPEARGAEVG